MGMEGIFLFHVVCPVWSGCVVLCVVCCLCRSESVRLIERDLERERENERERESESKCMRTERERKRRERG